MNEEKNIIIYQLDEGEIFLEVNLKEETVWLFQFQMAELFHKTVPTINEHIKTIYKEGELQKKPTIRKFRIVRKERKREVRQDIDYFNFDVIISVGYLVKKQVTSLVSSNSKQGE